jgi:hypothetical protein
MALIQCPECRQGISDQALACPKCGAPVRGSRGFASGAAAVAGNPHQFAPVVMTTRKPTLAALIVGVLILGAIAAFAINQRRIANLPPLPVAVEYRRALLGPGLVLHVVNNSNRYLSLAATLSNPTLNQQRSYRLDVRPNTFVEVGHREGWTLESGDKIRLVQNDYQPWDGSIP